MQVRTALDSCKDFRNLLTSKLNEIENKESILFQRFFFARINKLFVCCLKTSKRNQNHFQLLFQRLQFLDEACGIDLQYPRSQQTSMMVEIQTSFGVVKINCYGDVTVDKKSLEQDSNSNPFISTIRLVSLT